MAEIRGYNQGLHANLGQMQYKDPRGGTPADIDHGTNLPQHNEYFCKP